ncbi:MAG: TolC family protein [Candidatus Kapabacteria bacterium]|nr:TolC family protein [Candidatus Kapabacteria bacterium]
MKNLKIYFYLIPCILLLNSCINLNQTVREPDSNAPQYFNQEVDTTNIADIQWRNYFKDVYLQALIDSALIKNQELNIVAQEIEIRKNEILSRTGEYQPSVRLGVGSGLEKTGVFTRNGAVEEQLTIKDGQPFPSLLGDFALAANASWEVDIWRKLRDAKDASMKNYLASIEGKNFLVTQLVAEIAETYYELLALDNYLKTINENVEIQKNALKSVKLQKESAKATQLAVNRFEAQLLKTTNRQYSVKQRIIEKENHLNFLTGRFPTKIDRSSLFFEISIDSITVGIPSQLLSNRPDLKQAELELIASKLDVSVAKANFYPSLNIRGSIGFNAFNPAFLLNPESLIYNALGDLMAPLINRKGIEAAYLTASSKQLQAVFNYEQTILKAFVDVQNQVAKIENFSSSYDVKSKEVAILEQSVNIANSLFNSARADYVEVLLTQEEVLEAKLEKIEAKSSLLEGRVHLYRSLGGGWK